MSAEKLFSRLTAAFLGLFCAVSLAWIGSSASAQTSPPPQNPTPGNNTVVLPAYPPKSVNLNEDGFDIHHTDLNSFFEEFGPRFIRTMSGVVVLIAILVFMIGAGFWIFSSGNESLVERGKDMMMYSVIGLLFVLGAYVVVKTVQVILYALGT